MTKKKKTVLITASVLFCMILAFGLITLIYYLLPMSKAWAFTVNASGYTLHTGDTADIPYDFAAVRKCRYLLLLQDTKKDRLAFSSTDESVAAVDPYGRITAVGEGTAAVIAVISDEIQKVTVNVFTPGDSLSFSEEEYSLNTGGELALETVLMPENAVLFDEISFSSSDEKIVKVDGEGKITAVSPGEAEVSVTADGLRGIARVKVLQPMTGFAIKNIPDGSAIRMERGAYRKLNFLYYPENTTDDRRVTFRLSDPEMGSISEDGVYTALKSGSVILTAKCGKFSSSFTIDTHVTLRGISLSQETCRLSYPSSAALSWLPVPEDTTDSLDLSWSSENTKVVKVDENGNVTAVRGGTADVILRVNGFEKRCTFTVTVPVTGMRISTGSIFLYTGSGYGLSASLVPSFTTEDRSVVWTSDNPGIAAVNSSGGVTAVSPGVTVIRASHGSFSVACRVEVENMPTWEERADRIIAFGKQYLGTPYVYGGESLTGGLDCSSFTQQCFACQHIGLARTSYYQVNQGTAVSLDPSAWRKGDLIFYSPSGSVSHVAIYIGDGQILHCSQSMGGVCITSYSYNGYTPSHVRRYF